VGSQILNQLFEKTLMLLIFIQNLITTTTLIRVNTQVAGLRLLVQLAHRRVAKPVPASMDEVLCGFLVREVGVTVEHAVVLNTISVDSSVTHMLATEGANHIKLLQLRGIFVNEPGPLFHFIAGFLIELVLIEIVLLLKLLLHLPDYIIFEFEQTSLLFVMLD